jgi:hypothetical protein
MERMIFAVVIPAKQQWINIETEYYVRKIYDREVITPCFHRFDSDTSVMAYPSMAAFEKAKRRYQAFKTKKIKLVDSSLVREFFFEELIVLENNTTWAADTYLDARYAEMPPLDPKQIFVIERYRPTFFVRLFEGGTYEVIPYQDEIVKDSVIWGNSINTVRGLLPMDRKIAVS